MVQVMAGVSIYHDMYKWGLKHIDIHEIETACALAGVNIREKDRQNYWNGYYNSDLRYIEDVFTLSRNGMWAGKERSVSFLETEYENYPIHPYVDNEFEMEKRWVPCSKDNKPMIPWGEGCMNLSDAVAYKDQVYLAENLKGTRLIVIDCDGNHGDEPDVETMAFLNRWRFITHSIMKPQSYYRGIPMSFHLTFTTDHVIPTMHFPYAHIDIVGNRKNSLRYWKNKEWNGLTPKPMTKQMWLELQEYIGYRKDQYDATRNELA